MQTRRFIHYIALLVSCVYLVGCATVPYYSVEPFMKEGLPFPASISVQDLEDCRENRTLRYKTGIAMIPLVPYVNVEDDMNLPVDLGIDKSDPAYQQKVAESQGQDLPHTIPLALQRDLMQSNMFRGVYINKINDANLLLRGRLNKTYLHGKTYSYCLSIAAIAPWLLGAPLSTFSIDLDIDLYLREAISGKDLWSYKISSSKDMGAVGMYYGMVHEGIQEPFFTIGQLLKKGMEGAKQSLYKELSSKDSHYWAELQNAVRLEVPSEKAPGVVVALKEYIPPALAIPAPMDRGVNLGVLDLESVGCGASIGPAVSDTVRETLLSIGHYRVMERSDMVKLLTEQDFQKSGRCDDMQCIVQVGKILAVQKMVVGKVAKLGSTYKVTLRLVNVESARVDKIASEICTCPEDQLFQVAETAAKRLLLP